MKINKQNKNWWIDVLMLVGYLFCFYLEFTGVIGHEWLGVGIGLLAVLHTWLHWDWVVAVTKRFFAGTGANCRLFYLVDILIVIGFIVILETGLVISTWLNLDIMTYVVWLDIHTYTSYATLALLVLKVGIHWRWVVNITSRIFTSEKKPVPVRGLAPVPVPVNKELVDRRRFLGLMGVVGVGSLLAVINVVRENSIYSTYTGSNVTAMGSLETSIINEAQSATSEPATQSTTVAEDPAATTAENVTTAEPDASALTIAEPTTAPTLETQEVVAGCQVRCSKQCAFPGRCRRYIDENGNGLCDLGECL